MKRLPESPAEIRKRRGYAEIPHKREKDTGKGPEQKLRAGNGVGVGFLGWGRGSRGADL